MRLRLTLKQISKKMQTIETTVKHPNKENFTSRVLPYKYFERIQNLKENFTMNSTMRKMTKPGESRASRVARRQLVPFNGIEGGQLTSDGI